VDDLVQLRDGREIVLTPISVRSGAATVCGYCLITADRDHVYYAQSRSRLHRTHNAVHELAHLVLGHRSVAPLVAPGDSADRRRAWLGLVDNSYSERSEAEADAAAAILLGSWHEAPPRTWAAHSSLSRGAARLADAYT
jgi:Zn-dependent peptidase ImmA (M78 family)